MGTLETENARRAKRKNLQHLVLESVYVAGLIGAALVAPNVIGAMKKLGLDPTERQVESINVARKRLIQKGLLRYENGLVRLTREGERRVRMADLASALESKPKKWDGKWRMLIFDIPERRKSLRHKVRHTLISIGFHRLQDSVWVYPYNCEDLIALLKADFRVGKDLLYLIVEDIENDRAIRAVFGLPSTK